MECGLSNFYVECRTATHRYLNKTRPNQPKEVQTPCWMVRPCPVDLAPNSPRTRFPSNAVSLNAPREGWGPGACGLNKRPRVNPSLVNRRLGGLTVQAPSSNFGVLSGDVHNTMSALPFAASSGQRARCDSAHQRTSPKRLEVKVLQG